MVVSACIHGLFFISLQLVLDWMKEKLRGQTHEIVNIIQNIIADQVSVAWELPFFGWTKNISIIENILFRK